MFSHQFTHLGQLYAIASPVYRLSSSSPGGSKIPNGAIDWEGVAMKVTIWHMMPVTLGLHWVVLALPFSPLHHKSKTPPARAEVVKVVVLPKVPVTKLASVNALPAASTRWPVKPPTTTIPSARSPRPQPNPTPAPQKLPELPEKIAEKSLEKTPPKLPIPVPADALQIQGGTPCQGLSGCWQMSDNQGRRVAANLEEHLQSQGYELNPEDLADETGMQVYKVHKAGEFQFYLHLTWGDRGTVYVRNPELLSRADLEARM